MSDESILTQADIDFAAKHKKLRKKRKIENITEYCKKYTTQAVATLLEVMQDKKASATARVTAATNILDRAFGKPKSQNESVKLGLTYEEFLKHAASKENIKEANATVYDDYEDIKE